MNFDLFGNRFELRAGALTMLYDNGDLRYVRVGDDEILLRVYAAVRDRDWGTVPGDVTIVKREVGADSFRIVTETHYLNAETGVDFSARTTLTGTKDSTITFDFDGTANSDFERNRIGICVLHPAHECAGDRVEVAHRSDGSREMSRFPFAISPHQPLFDIATLRCRVRGKVEAEVLFDGDLFEMEDQRNWMDASFKTYSTPLNLPTPVLVPKGTTIYQVVTLKLHGYVPAQADFGGRHLLPTETLATQGGNEPIDLNIGLMLTRQNIAVSLEHADALSALRLDHLRVDGNAADLDFDLLYGANSLALRIGAGLFVGIHNADVLTADLLSFLSRFRCVYLFAASPNSIQQVRQHAANGTQIGTGSTTNFTELNRNRPDMTQFDAMVFAANPQVHAFDDLSIAETPTTLQDILQTARTFADGKEIHIGPLTLYGSYKPNDARQKTDFGANWYRNCLKYARLAGAATVTLCETVGERGVMAKDGTPYPLYNVLLHRSTGRNQ